MPQFGGIGAKTLPRIRAWQRQAVFDTDIDLADVGIVEDAREILRLSDQVDHLDSRIQATASARLPMAQRLRAIPGFGSTDTAELAGEIGAFKRFDNEASLAVYPGSQLGPATTWQTFKVRALSSRVDNLCCTTPHLRA